MLLKTFLITLLLISGISSSPLLNKGDAFRVFFWVCYNPGDSLLHGNYGYVKIDSVNESSSLYYTRLGLPGYSWWRQIFNRVYLKSVIRIKDTLPDGIDLCCDAFKNAEWLHSFERKDSVGIINFVFPILPIETSYHKYDFFSIKVDTAVLQFQWIDDSTTIGTLMNDRHKGDGRTVIYAKNVIAVRLTNSNPLRIKDIQIDTARSDLISSYLNFNFKRYTNNAKWYGLSIIDNSFFIVEKPKLLIIQ